MQLILKYVIEIEYKQNYVYYIEFDDGTKGDIDFSPFRKSNSKRPDPPWKRFLQHHYRKIVETSGSLIERLLPIGVWSNQI